MRLLLARHGQTDWNVQGRWQGGADVPLNAEGRREAEALAAMLAGERLDAVYCGTLSRSLETAALVARVHGLVPHADPRLNEICLGEWEGLSADEIEAAYPAVYREWVERPGAACPPGGETLAQVRDRAIAAVEEVRAAYPSGTVCVVTHKTVIVVVRSHYLGLDVRDEMARMPANATYEVIEG